MSTHHCSLGRPNRLTDKAFTLHGAAFRRGLFRALRKVAPREATAAVQEVAAATTVALPITTTLDRAGIAVAREARTALRITVVPVTAVPEREALAAATLTIAAQTLADITRVRAAAATRLGLTQEAAALPGVRERPREAMETRDERQVLAVRHMWMAW